MNGNVLIISLDLWPIYTLFIHSRIAELMRTHPTPPRKPNTKELWQILHSSDAKPLGQLEVASRIAPVEERKRENRESQRALRYGRSDGGNIARSQKEHALKKIRRNRKVEHDVGMQETTKRINSLQNAEDDQNRTYYSCFWGVVLCCT